MRIKICTADLAVGGNSKGTLPVSRGALHAAPRSAALSAIAGAALLTVGSLVSGNAQALTLGSMTVQSNLGEPLRAEVQVFDLTPAEAASLTVQPASPAAFQAAGVDYNSALAGMQVRIERRANGQAVLVVTGARPASEPFLDVLLEANWAGGRLSRNYTVLLDPPPAGQRTPPAPPLAPVIAPTPVPAPAPVAPRFQPPAPIPVPLPAPRVVRPAPAPAPRVPIPAPAADGGRQITVRAGDTAGGIARRAKAPSVSLDQMLVAMLQANPDAFLDGNVNRIRAGAVLDVPSTADASAIPAAQAQQTVIAQSRDFNEFRRRLAAGAPTVNRAAPQRQASGSVQAQVQENRPAATTPDRLTLSKGAANTPAAAEAERIARAKQEHDSAQRLAELSRNVNELNRLGTTPGSNATSAPTTAPPAPSKAPAPAPANAVASAPAAPTAPIAPAAAPGAAAAPVAAVPAKPAVAAPAPVPAPEASTSWFDDSPLADPKILGVVGLLVALVVALVSYRTIRRRRGIANDSGFADKGPDSFFGGSGGQQVNTGVGGPSTLATSYSPSQLDAGGEVDPIAEADVYLAYGRDLQAEEILKEALRTNPARTALHAKLAEIYAKRKDVAAFHALAEDAHRLTGGSGADWDRIHDLGEELDPSHPLFRAAGAAAAVAAVGTVAAFAAEPPPPPPPPPAPAPLPDPVFDEPIEPAMDDISLDFDPMPDEPPAAAREPEPELELPPSLDLDFGAFTPGAPPSAPSPAPAPAADDEPDFGLDFNLDDFDTPAPAQPPEEEDPDALPALDLSGFSLDLDDEPEPQPAPAPVAPPPPAPAPVAAADTDLPDVPADDALATKLALADEFNAIGDVDGARHLIEEVISEATGAVRERAQRMLSSLQ